jgi:protein-L-isoaspartate O-methyltransferase
LHAEHIAACKPAAPNADIEAMRAALKAGVQVVSAPQLFPTPPELAARMVELAGIEAGMRVLEPSAGTGALLGAMGGRPWGEDLDPDRVHAIEIHRGLCERLRVDFPLTEAHSADFLSIEGPGAFVGGEPREDAAPLGQFDRIIMNPPFGGGADIQHISHALKFLKPGGRLVALCANGPRQNDKLRPLVEACGGDWEVLPADSFNAEGTGVSVALITLLG